jgi:hypothetical protein
MVQDDELEGVRVAFDARRAVSDAGSRWSRCSRGGLGSSGWSAGAAGWAGSASSTCSQRLGEAVQDAQTLLGSGGEDSEAWYVLAVALGERRSDSPARCS